MYTNEGDLTKRKQMRAYSLWWLIFIVNVIERREPRMLCTLVVSMRAFWERKQGLVVDYWPFNIFLFALGPFHIPFLCILVSMLLHHDCPTTKGLFLWKHRSTWGPFPCVVSVVYVLPTTRAYPFDTISQLESCSLVLSLSCMSYSSESRNQHRVDTRKAGQYAKTWLCGTEPFGTAGWEEFGRLLVTSQKNTKQRTVI